MTTEEHNALVVLGPTASGKTALAARLAHALGGAVISADSRQVYRGLDIGSGKDLAEYTVDGQAVPYSLIDIVDLGTEYSVFDYQRDCFAAFERVRGQGLLPVIAGGTGLYIEAVLDGYRMAPVPEDPALRAELAALDDAALGKRLRAARPGQHNVTDLTGRDRTVRAIEIAEYTRAHPPEPGPDIHALLLGTRWGREELRRRIRARLDARLGAGLVEEVEALHAQGWTWERLDLLGLEYRIVSRFLRGDIRNRNDLKQKLGSAIAQFAKRQETWFRRMERKGHEIHWVARADFDEAMRVVRAHW